MNTSSKNSPNQDINYKPPTDLKEDKKSFKKESTQFSLLSKSIGIVHVIFLWIIFLFFVLLLTIFIVGVVRVLFDAPVDRDFFGIIAAFLAGSLGAGFGDKIFAGIRRYWNYWIENKKQ